jgi:PadR family transcriptional regulator PadR
MRLAATLSMSELLSPIKNAFVPAQQTGTVRNLSALNS